MSKDIVASRYSRIQRIEARIRTIQPMYTLDGVQSEILIGVAEEFQEIKVRLTVLEEKLSNKSIAQKVISSPELLDELNDINAKLAKKEDMLRVLGMVGAFNLEQRRTNAHMISLLTERNSENSVSGVSHANLASLYQMQLVSNNVQNKTSSGESVLDQRSGFLNCAAGICIYEGRLGPKNYVEAAQYFNMAIQAGNVGAYYFLGILYKYGLGVEKCYSTAKNLLQIGTDARDPAAISELGHCYNNAIGVERDGIKGMSLIRRGAEGGDPYGLSIYSWHKLRGCATDANPSLAYSFAKKASKKGYALDELGSCYEYGLGTDRNTAEAVRLYKESIEEGKSWTVYMDLARCYEQGIGVEKDFAKAAELYKQGSEFDDWKGNYFHADYGLCLIRGRGVFEDKEKGWYHIQKSIQGDNATGWYAKGECYRYGYGAEIDLNEAVTCYKNAISSTCGAEAQSKAQFALGTMYERGQGGLPCDYRKAFELFTVSAIHLHQQAQWKAGLYCESGVGTERFLERAVYYFRLAAASGHRKAQIRASKYYMKGKGVSRDLHTAAQILQPAAERGDLRANLILGRIRLTIFIRRDRRSTNTSYP